MNAHQRRIYKRLYERAFGNHVDYYVQITIRRDDLKVVSEGGKWEQRFTCNACKSVVEITEDDLQAGNFAAAYAGEKFDPQAYFVCPVCNSRVFVGIKPPRYVLDKLFDQLRTDDDATA